MTCHVTSIICAFLAWVHDNRHLATWRMINFGSIVMNVALYMFVWPIMSYYHCSIQHSLRIHQRSNREKNSTETETIDVKLTLSSYVFILVSTLLAIHDPQKHYNSWGEWQPNVFPFNVFAKAREIILDYSTNRVPRKYAVLWCICKVDSSDIALLIIQLHSTRIAKYRHTFLVVKL